MKHCQSAASRCCLARCLDDCRNGPPKWKVCDQFVEVLEARRPEEVLPTLPRAAVERAAATGLHAAGFLTYEAASRHGPGISTHASGPLPLASFSPLRAMRNALPTENVRFHRPAMPTFPAIGRRRPIGNNTKRPSTTSRITSFAETPIRSTTPCACGRRFAATPGRGFCAALAQQIALRGLIDTGRHILCSASPELFFPPRRRGLVFGQ